MDSEEKTPAPAWMKTATVIVYLLLAAAVAYIGWAVVSQRTYFDLMAQLTGGTDEQRAAAVQTLESSDNGLPYVCSTLLNGIVPRNRLACAKIIMARLDARREAIAEVSDEATRREILRAHIDLYDVTAALTDEYPPVRQEAWKIVQLLGTDEIYQKNRVDDMHKFDALLVKLKTGDEAARVEAVDAFQDAGEGGVRFLVGTVFWDTPEERLRGMKALKVVVDHVLRGSNQRRIVPLLGRRCCQLLIREMLQMKPDTRQVVRDILNISGRIRDAYFDEMQKALQSLPQPVSLAAIRPWVVGGDVNGKTVTGIEELEKVRRGELPEAVKKKISPKQ